jgi:hypothetical protein
MSVKIEGINGECSRWDFKVHAQDIKFGIRAVDQKTGDKLSEVDLRRIAASESDETGFITCQANHKCKFVDEKCCFVTFGRTSL